MTMKRELNKRNGARYVVNRNLTGQRAFSLIGGLRRLLAFAVLSIVSTSTAWAACTGGMTISAAPLSHTYSTISDRTIVISGTVSKSGSFCGFAGIPAGTVQARVGGVTANIPYDKFSRKFSGNLVLPAGFTAGSYTLQMDFISANTSILSSRQSFSYTLKSARQTIDGLPFGTTTLTPGKTIALNVSASSGLPVTLSASPSYICALQAGKIVLYGAGNCSIVGTQSGNTNYLPGYGSSTITVLRAQQTITVPAIGTQSMGANKVVPLNITTSSGLPVFLTTLTPNTCVASGRDALLTAAGLCRFRVNSFGNNNYYSATPVDFQFGIVPGPQTPLVLKATQPSIAFGGTTNLTISGGNGTGAIGLTLTAGGSVCALSGGILKGIGAGACTLTATKDADANYLAAKTTLNVTVNKASQLISFPVPASRPFVDGGTIALNASSDQGLPVAIITTTPQVCGVSGSAAFIRNAGRCGLYASNPGNQNVSGTNTIVAFNITKATQAPLNVTASPASITPGGTTSLSTIGGSGTGAIIYTITAGGTFCSLSGTTVTATGSGTCTLTATKAADINHIAAVSATVDITAVKATQTISFTPPKDRVYVAGEAIALSAAASSGLPVTFSTTSPGICSINRNTLAILSAGTCALTAQQAGNVIHKPVSIAAQFTIFKAPQTISFTNPGAQLFSPGKIITFSATNSSGLPFYFRSLTTKTCTTVGASGKTAVLNAPGVCSIVVINGGDKNYLLTSTKVSFDINKAGQSALTLSAAPASITFGGTTALSTTGGSGTGAVTYALSAGRNVCSISGNTLSGIGVGTCTVTATKAADTNFAAATNTVDVIVAPAAQTALLSSASPASIAFNGTSTLGTTGGSGTGVVTYALSAGRNVCSLSGATLTGIGVGTCTVTATKAADANFAATTSTVDVTVAPAAQTALVVSASPTTITALSGPVTLQSSGGSGTGAVSYSVTAGGADCSISANQLSCTGVGTVTVTATKAGDANFDATVATVNITFNTTPVIAEFAIAGGRSQSATIDTAFAMPLTVKVNDALGRGLSGIIVTFSAPMSGPGATLSALTATTNNAGLAKITVRANGQPGSYKVIATVADGSKLVFLLSNNRDSLADIRQTQRVVRGFIARRADQFIASAPDLSNRLSGISRSADGLVGLTGAVDSQNARLAFSFSLRGALDVFRKRKNQSHPDQPGTFGLAGGNTSALRDLPETGFDLWVEGKWSRTKSGHSDTTSSIVYGGVDYRFNSDFLAGVMVQYDWSNETTSAQNTSASGKGWLAGPYMVARVHQNLLFDGRIAWGQSHNSVNALGLTTDGFDSTRWLAHGRLTGDFKSGAWRFSPHIDVNYFEEEQQSYVDGLGNKIPGQTVTLGRATFGPKVHHKIEWEDGSSLTPFFGVRGIWDFKLADIGPVQGITSGSTGGLRGRMEAGIVARTQLGINIDAKAFYDGIGAKTLEAYGGSLRATITFD